MTTTKKTKKSGSKRPAKTPEARENQLISLAVDLAEQQLRDGTAKATTINHFLDLATVKKQLELEKLKKETKLLEAKTESIESARRTEALYQEAMDAFMRYSGRKEDISDAEDL